MWPSMAALFGSIFCPRFMCVPGSRAEFHCLNSPQFINLFYSFRAVSSVLVFGVKLLRAFL